MRGWGWMRGGGGGEGLGMKWGRGRGNYKGCWGGCERWSVGVGVRGGVG